MLCRATLCHATHHPGRVASSNSSLAPYPGENPIPAASKLGTVPASRSPSSGTACAQCAVAGGETSLQDVLRLTGDDYSAGAMVMAESQSLATVSFCLPQHGSGGQRDTFQYPGGPQTHADGGRGWCGDICDPHAHCHHIPKLNQTLGMVTTTFPPAHRSPPPRCCFTWMRGRRRW